MTDLPKWAMEQARTIAIHAARHVRNNADAQAVETIVSRRVAEAIASVAKAERERAAGICNAYEGKPCGPAQLWTDEQRKFYDAGQIDATASCAAAILSDGGRDG